MAVRRSNWTPLFPILIFFILLNTWLIAGKFFLEKYGFDQSVLIVGNLVLFGATILSFFSATRGLRSADARVFVRGVYVSIMVKLVICAVAALIYIFIFRRNLNKPSLFTCMGLYLVYTFLEVSVLTKLLKEKKHA